MQNMVICRVCLATNLLTYDVVNSNLRNDFENITNIQLTLDDIKPNGLCFLCYNQLKKCHEFRIKSLQAEAIITKLILNSKKLSKESLESLELKPALSYNLRTISLESVNVLPSDNIKEECWILKVEDNDELGRQEMTIEDDVKPKEEEVQNNEPDFDSEDDVPLQIINRKEDRKASKTTVPLSEFAEEIILSKEEQLKELQNRSLCDNYLKSPFRCDLCFKGFISSKSFDNHCLKHDEKSGSFSCEICQLRYQTERQVRTHVECSHRRRLQCLRCSYLSHTPNQARDHQKWHEGYTYNCKICGLKFRKPTSYLTHARKQHPGPSCRYCGENFAGRLGLKLHLSKTHNNEPRGEESAVPAAQRACGACAVTFVSRDAWRAHLLSSGKHIDEIKRGTWCPICDAQFGAQSASRHLHAHRVALLGRARAVPSRAACTQCPLSFPTRSRLQAHVNKVHLGISYKKVIVCEICGRKCSSNATLRYHQRTHSGQKPYGCVQCGKHFADSYQLRTHARTHSGEKPYQCTVCLKTFSQKPTLNRHTRVHTGEKPYECSYCSKTFTQKTSVKIHINTVHLKIPYKRNKNKKNALQAEQKDVVE